MEKKLDEKVYRMTNITFEEKMKLLFDIEEKIKYNNPVNTSKGNKKKIAIVYDVDRMGF